MAYADDTSPVNLDTGEGASNTITGMLRGARGLYFGTLGGVIGGAIGGLAGARGAGLDVSEYEPSADR
jgi:hypothetical protein